MAYPSTVSMLTIDGSHLEGGGQILRISLLLSSLLQVPVTIYKIRGNRPKPGLQAQHVTVVNLLKKLTNQEEMAKIGDNEVEFIPNGLYSCHDSAIICDIGTAGSVTLVLQAVGPLLALLKMKLKLTGGTNVTFSPSIDIYQNTFIPFLNTVGIKCKLDCVKRGFYPRGGGVVQFHGELVSMADLKSFEFNDPGKLVKFHLKILLSSELCNEISKLKLYCDHSNVQLEYDFVNDRKYVHYILVAETTNLSMLTVSGMVTSFDSLFTEISTGVVHLSNLIQQGIAVDEYHQDQILLFMAFTEKSSFSTVSLSLHSQAAIYVIETFFPDKNFDFSNNKMVLRER